MAQITTVVLKDRESTPVNHTFVPNGMPNGSAAFTESTGTPIGDSVMTLTNKRSSGGRRMPTLDFRFPKVQTETINGISKPTVVRTNYAKVVFNFDPSSDTQERKNIVGMVEDALKSAQTFLNDTIVNLNDPY